MTLEEYLKKNYSSTAVKGYEHMIRRYLSYTLEAEEAGCQEVLNYIGQLRKTSAHAKTIRNNLFAVKIYYNFLLETKQRADHPCKDLNLQDQINRSIAVESLYSREMLESFFETYQSKQPKLKQRDKVMISLLIYQAMAVSEVSQLQIKDMDLDKGTIYIKGSVKNKERTLHLKPNQIMLLHKYLTESRPELLQQNKKEQSLILTLEGKPIAAHGISRQINYKRKKHERMLPIKIRQSVIAHLLKAGKDLRVVQVFAGHRRAGSTEAYRQTGLEELKLAIQKLHPLG